VERSRNDAPKIEQAVMHRMDQLKKAVRLIEPSKQDNAECREEVAATLKQLDYEKLNHQALTIPGTKEGKRYLEPLDAAVRRVQNITRQLYQEHRGLCFEIFLCWKRQDNDPVQFDPGALDDHGYNQFTADLKRLGDRITEYTKFVSVESSGMKYRAALSAFILLRKYNSKSVTTTKGGQLCKLAALLYGDGSADLQHQCRDVVRSWGSPAKREKRQK
jgi:hypothetical protein